MKLYALLAIALITASIPARAADWTIRRKGANLVKNGHPWRLIGGNNYRTAGGPGATACQMAYDPSTHAKGLDALFAQLQRDGLNTLRIWAFQSYAGPSGLDFRNFDRVVAAAATHHIRLIMVLENQWDACSSGGIKPASWYQSGYAKPYGSYALSYPSYVDALVRHYRGNIQIAAWQLMNEGESTDGASLATFARTMAARIKSADPTHLVSVGTLACGQYGTDPANMQAVHASPDIDLVEAHDYGQETQGMPSCIAADLAVARGLGKPFFLGEVGLSQGTDPQRASNLTTKMNAHTKAGTQGFLVWSLYDGGSTDGFQVPLASKTRQALIQGARRFEAPIKDEL